jgi:hypothetical protein
MWRFHSPNIRGRYGEESKEGQDREEGQEGKSKKEEVVFWARADSFRPGNLTGLRTATIAPRQKWRLLVLPFLNCSWSAGEVRDQYLASAWC